MTILTVTFLIIPILTILVMLFVLTTTYIDDVNQKGINNIMKTIIIIMFLVIVLLLIFNL